MPTIVIVKDTLTDGSEVFDLLIQDDFGASTTIAIDATTEDQATRKIAKFHAEMEKISGHIVWADMLNKKAGWTLL